MNTKLNNGMGSHAGAWEPGCRPITRSYWEDTLSSPHNIFGYTAESVL